MRSKKKLIKTRDHLMVKVINGVTKGGVHKDLKKEDDKYAAREKVEVATEDDVVCLQCGFPIDGDQVFCSETCREFFEEMHGEE